MVMYSCVANDEFHYDLEKTNSSTEEVASQTVNGVKWQSGLTSTQGWWGRVVRGLCYSSLNVAKMAPPVNDLGVKSVNHGSPHQGRKGHTAKVIIYCPW